MQFILEYVCFWMSSELHFMHYFGDYHWNTVYKNKCLAESRLQIYVNSAPSFSYNIHHI